MSLSMEVIQTTKGKPSLIYDGYRYCLDRKKQHCIFWRCLKNKSAKCKGRLKTTNEYDVLESSPHQCVSKPAEIELDKTKFICRKRAREELTKSVSQIFKEEFGKVSIGGCEPPNYNIAKKPLFQARREALDTIHDPTSSAEIELSEDVITQSDGSSFLLFDFTSEDEKRCLVFSGKIGKKHLKSNDNFLFDGTLKSCPKQFKQMYSIHSYFGSFDKLTNIYPLAYVFLEDQRKSSYICLFSKFKNWGWSPKTIKIGFEGDIIEAFAEVFPQTDVTGYSYSFNQCLWQDVQQLGIVQDFMLDSEVRMVCRMCAVLALIPEEEVENAWHLVRAINPDHKKINKFLDYFVDQWLNNASIPIRMWNVHGKSYQTKNPVEKWICKFHKAVGDPHPNVYLMIKKLKQDAADVHTKVIQMEMCLRKNKLRKKSIDLDQHIQRTLNRYLEEDVLKCLRVLALIVKLDKVVLKDYVPAIVNS